MINGDMFSLSGFLIVLAIVAIIGWAVIEFIIWLFSFVHISIG